MLTAHENKGEGKASASPGIVGIIAGTRAMQI